MVLQSVRADASRHRAAASSCVWSNSKNPQGLRKEGANLYSMYDTTIRETAGASQVRQGFLESSNVDLSSQMASMIEIYRSHEINQRMVKIFDEKLGKSVNEIGRL